MNFFFKLNKHSSSEKYYMWLSSKQSFVVDGNASPLQCCHFTRKIKIVSRFFFSMIALLITTEKIFSVKNPRIERLSDLLMYFLSIYNWGSRQVPLHIRWIRVGKKESVNAAAQQFRIKMY